MTISVFKDFNIMFDISPRRPGWFTREFRYGAGESYTRVAKISTADVDSGRRAGGPTNRQGLGLCGIEGGSLLVYASTPGYPLT